MVISVAVKHLFLLFSRNFICRINGLCINEVVTKLFSWLNVPKIRPIKFEVLRDSDNIIGVFCWNQITQRTEKTSSWTKIRSFAIIVAGILRKNRQILSTVGKSDCFSKRNLHLSVPLEHGSNRYKCSSDTIDLRKKSLWSSLSWLKKQCSTSSKVSVWPFDNRAVLSPAEFLLLFNRAYAKQQWDYEIFIINLCYWPCFLGIPEMQPH